MVSLEGQDELLIGSGDGGGAGWFTTDIVAGFRT